MISLKELVDAGVQFGHVVAKRNPNMDRYIWGVKNKVNLIDVSKTAAQLRKANAFLESVVKSGRQVLWVGTKKQAQGTIKEVAERLSMPYVDHRWVGGTLSNYAQVKKSVTKLLHYEDVVAKADKFPNFTKKELNVMYKAAGRLAKIVGGIKKLTWPVGAIVIVDVGRSESALKEAVSMGIPVVAIVDTNDDPSSVTFPIPANDDAESSIRILLMHMAEAVERGLAVAAVEKKRIAEEKKLVKPDVAPVIAQSKKAEDSSSPKKYAGKGKAHAPIHAKQKPALKNDEKVSDASTVSIEEEISE